MEKLDGVFVLLVSTAGDVTAGDFAGSTRDEGHGKAVELYINWLQEFARECRPGAVIEQVPGGRGEYAGVVCVHDAVIVRWDTRET